MPKHIFDFWDGSKCCDVQDLWNPDSDIELPVICENLHCKKIYATFLWTSMSCTLQDSRNEQDKEHNFVCKKCRLPIKCGKKYCKGDPHNFALLLHWDGFEASCTTQKDRGVVEIFILNARRKSIVRVMSVLFILFSCKLR